MRGSERTTIVPPKMPGVQPPMTADELSVFFARRQRAFDALDAAALAADYASDCQLESPTAGLVRGRAAVEKVYRAWFDAFLDLSTRSASVVVDNVENGRVAQVLDIEGTDIGGFMGLPASGRTFHFSADCIYQFQGRLIVSERRIYDFAGVLVQLGVLKTKPL